MATIANIQQVDPNNFQLQNYSSEDESLISNSTQDVVFNPSEDYIEYFILDLEKTVISGNINNFSNYSLIDNLIHINPQKDLEDAGFTEGQYYTVYNFLKRKLSSSFDRFLYIQDISSDRTELRLNSTTISNVDLVDLATQLSNQIFNAKTSYIDFYLDFGNNQLIIANNIAVDTSDPNDPSILIKLYDPLPEEFSFNSQCWVVEQIAESLAYQIELETIFELEEELNYISGPNFNLDIQDQINNSTSYYNQNTLNQTLFTLGSGSFLYQINSLLAEKGIEINVDYSDYSNFIHFSSAKTRLENFYYKLALIEEYQYSSSYTPTTTNIYTAGSQQIWLNRIDDIITNFDGYEYYLYYSSGSDTWPKVNSEPPYVNEPTTSITALAWLTNQLNLASSYDRENINSLIRSIPNYIVDDPNNEKYLLFIQMIGQHFDNVWLYLKDVTNKFDADNRLDYGISKDIVAQAIRDLGIKIYQNNFSTDNLYSALLGITPSGSLFNIPNVTGSLPIPAYSGLEYIDTFITASYTSSLQPVDDINKEIYKRIYHNTPKLLKKKGSTEGLRMLINLYGIPDTILRVNEFGGKSYQNQSWDNFADQFNYAFYSEGTGYISSFLGSPAGRTPTTVEFRFKTNGIPSVTPYQEILYTSTNAHIYLNYTSSRYSSGSYSGSIPSSSNTYADLIFYNGTSTAKIGSLPFYNGDWWSIMLTSNNSVNTLYAGNKIYNGYDGSSVGFIKSASVGGTLFNAGFPKTITLSSPSPVSLPGVTCYPFSGSFQELRIYSFTSNTITLNTSSFRDYIMNPYSIESNNLSGSQTSLNSLFFRAPLGTVLDNSGSGTQTRISIHPSITKFPVTQSFSAGNSNYTLNGTYIFEPNTEYIYQDQFVAGVKNAVSEKIRIVNPTLPSGSTLSQYITIQQPPSLSAGFTKDINYIEAAFSPQDEINDDIIAQLGSFNIGHYIGDPRQLLSLTTSGSLNYYPDFNKLRDNYFSKYSGSYDLNDYIRLIKFYDNSLFKMIKDFTPSRAGLASGIVIKQTLLERCRYPQPLVDTNSTITFIGSPTSRTLNISY